MPTREITMQKDTSNTVLSTFNWGHMGGTAETCITCKILLEAAHLIASKSIQRRDDGDGFEQDTDERLAKLGRLGDILENSSCEAHKDFVRHAFSLDESQTLPTRLISEDGVVEMGWRVETGFATLALYGSDSCAEEDVLLLDSEPDHFGLSCMGRSRDEGFINIDLLKDWISTCETYHTESCCVSTSPSTSLSYMIDTISCCLVPARQEFRYVALSYVWGQTEMIKTTKETLSALQEAGALGANTHLKIPQVIRNATALVSRLGERYLWVDSLCIIQDDQENLHRHIRHMASIYASALFTIVAADGLNAEHGILGIRGISAARELPPSLQLTSKLRLQLRKSVNILASPWGGRGWTLQEHIFSRRKLVFVHDSVQWICQECRCFEDICQVSPSIRKMKRREYDIEQELESLGDLALEYPMISELEGLLHDYSTRHLTYQGDVLNAVGAVFTAHRKAFPHGFLLGLPIDFLDMALLWSHSYRSARRQARLHSSRTHFPSWTWAGWVGVLKNGQWRSAAYIKDADEESWIDRKECQTIPILEWWYRSSSDSLELLIPGQNSVHAYKQNFMGKKTGLPRGWKYEDESFGPVSEKDTRLAESNSSSGWALATPYYYSYDAAPGVKFWHPVPVLLEPLSTTMVPANARILCAKTRRGRLWVISAKNHPDGIKGLPFVGVGATCVRLFSHTIKVDTVLTNEKGDLVGDLRIDDREDIHLVNELKCEADQAGLPCELVAISKGNDFIEPMEPLKETYTFDNVLWIKWEDGIAYRRGVGRVTKETWESMELEDVDLVLG